MLPGGVCLHLLPPHRHQFLSVQHDVMPVIPLIGVVSRWYTLLSTVPMRPAYLPLVIFTRSPRFRIHCMEELYGVVTRPSTNGFISGQRYVYFEVDYVSDVSGEFNELKR